MIKNTLLVIGIILVLGFISYLFLNPIKKTPNNFAVYVEPTPVSTPTSIPTQSDTNLNSESDTLDTTSTTQIDTQLNALDNDSSNF